MSSMLPAFLQIEINWLRGLYIAIFFCNAIFATMFKTIGRDLLSSFGTFSDCDETDGTSCQGNQMIFRASFSISMFFLIRALLSRFSWVQPRARAIKILVWVEIPVLIALLVGSFYIPNSFFDGYVPFTRAASGFFILFQIFSIVSVSYQVRDTLLDGIEQAEKAEARGDVSKGVCASSVCLWKTAFLGVCAVSMVCIGSGITYLYMRFADCDLGLAFTTITIASAGLLIITCVSPWIEVGLLPPCAISAYLVLMCWQALVSNPVKSCEHRRHPPPSPQDEESSNTDSVIANAVIAAFAMTWTSWRTSSAATKMLVRRRRSPQDREMPVARPVSDDRHHDQQFASVVVVDVHSDQQHTDESPPLSPAGTTVEPPQPNRELIHEPWQFYSMMCLAGLYMAMVLTDWNSADGSFNNVSMWVKIVAQWVTILLFAWTLVAPKLFPDRDFS
ncbi:TMS membrane protein [Phytophthora cinnamomi]|uniref:TMS membrane protein n=1 Tax=Phytophthora cinnamomi TaxID=4785 RepID=UPI00355AA25D|nr:TMS membrane protein [Phytophthora cinnamomi]